MRKVLLLGFGFFLLSSVVYGQEPRVSGGLKIGGNLNFPNWDPDVPIGSLSSGLSFNFGGMIDFDISKNFGIEVNILYNNFRTCWDYSEIVLGVPVNYEATYSLTTLSLPILAKAKFPSKQVTPFFGIGPELGFILLHKGKIKATALGESIEDTEDLMYLTTSVNFALTLCVGFDINLRQIKLVPELRFSLGLTDYENGNLVSRKNSQIILFFGVKF